MNYRHILSDEIKLYVKPWTIAFLLVISIIVSSCAANNQMAKDSDPSITTSSQLTTQPVGRFPVDDSLAYEIEAASIPISQSQDLSSGIWVTGSGRISAEPDIVILSLGVEAKAAQVSEANQKAAEAMSKIIKRLKNHDLEETALQTTSFNIYPQYEYREVLKNGLRQGTQVLVGYTVSNRITAKIKDIDSIGEIIDDVVKSGGDFVRIDGIRFSIENQSPIMSQLRQAAMENAFEKAQHFADLSGVQLKSLIFIRESTGFEITPKNMGMQRFALEASPASATPPISGGALDMDMDVEVGFSIQ